MSQTETHGMDQGLPEIDSNSKTLRMAIFSDSFPERNGAGAYYHDLSSQLRPHLQKLESFQPAVKTRFLSLALPLPGDSTQKIITPNVFRLSKQYNALKPHVVVAVTPGPFGLLGMYFAKRSGAAFITGFHTHFEGLVQMYGNTLFFKTAFWYLELVNKILCRNSKAVLINNDGLLPTINRLGAKSHELVGTPLSGVFLNTPVKPLPNNFETVIFAGRLAPEKNLPAVMQAAKENPEIKFVIAGEGPLRKSLEKEASILKNVRFTGWLNRKDLLTEIDSASLLLLPSHMETFGTVALEALARGRPALVSEKAGIHHWKVLEDSLFTIPGNSNLSECIKRIKTSDYELIKNKANAARLAAEQLNNETISGWVDLIVKHSQKDQSSA